MTRLQVIKRLKPFLKRCGFGPMPDVTYHHVDHAIRVEFKQRAVLIEMKAPGTKWLYLTEAA